MKVHGIAVAVALGACLPRAAAAQEDLSVDEAAREAEIFGLSTEDTETVDSRDDAIFGGVSPTEANIEALEGDDQGASESLGLSPGPTELEIAQRLAEADDPLAIGGMLYQRVDWTARNEGYPETFPWRTPALLDLYLDARPNDRVRAFLKGRLVHDFTARGDEVDRAGRPIASTRVLLDQLWLNWDMNRTVFVTVGQQQLRWGSGRFWNPTDFLNRSFKPVLDIFDERLGLTLIKFHLPIESLGWNFYAIADLGGARTPEDVSGAFRGEFLYKTTELALLFAAGKNEPLRLGADLTTAVGPVDLRFETALMHDVRTPGYEGVLDFTTFTFPSEIDRSETWFFRLTAGAELGINITEEDALYLGVEYFYNGLGYEDASLYPWLIAQGAFTPFYLGRHYLAVYGLLPSPGRFDDLSVVFSGITNLSDRSVVARLDFSLRVVTYLRFNVYVSSHLGKKGEFRFGLDLPPAPAIPGLEEGLRIAPPLLDVGLGLTLTL